MKKLLTLLSAALLLQAGNTFAQTAQFHIDGSLLPKGLSVERINKKLQSLQTTSSIGLNKTTSSERVATITNYDFSQPPGSQVVDTVRLKYSSGRGSGFDFSNLYYDFYNHAEHPNPFIFNNNHVNFDTARNAANGNLMAFRMYNANGMIVKYQDDTLMIQTTYDASNRPTIINQNVYDASSGSWQSNARDLYYYNSAGQLILDSVEQWDASSGWQEAERLKYTYDASGRVNFLSVEYQYPSGSIYVIAHQTVTYTGSLTSPASVVTELTNGHGLDSFYRENFIYSNSALVSHDAYKWNNAAWDLAIQERRHLNAASLPDSVFFRYWSAGTATDSIYSKLAYDGQNNPLYRMDCDLVTRQPFAGSSWTYESTSTTGIGHVNVERLEFYPNPVSEDIHIKGVNGGNYAIYNTAGQIALSGKLQSDAIIPVQMLAPGMYLVDVQSAEGKRLQANFVRL